MYSAAAVRRRSDHNKHTWWSVVNVRASESVWSQVLCEFCYANDLLMDKRDHIYLSIDITAMPIIYSMLIESPFIWICHKMRTPVHIVYDYTFIYLKVGFYMGVQECSSD